MGVLDGMRARAFGLLDRFAVEGRSPIWRAAGRVRDVALRANEALGRPLASADELADRRAFDSGAPAPVPASAPVRDAATAAPVIVYHLDKHRRDLPRFTQVLDGASIPYRVMNLEGDPATQAAVRRDASGRKLPLVFVAGECIGGREELNALDRSGELKQKVWPQ